MRMNKYIVLSRLLPLYRWGLLCWDNFSVGWWCPFSTREGYFKRLEVIFSLLAVLWWRLRA
eukprot:5873460-Lingulodinium_polyedra.AAC.1